MRSQRTSGFGMAGLDHGRTGTAMRQLRRHLVAVREGPCFVRDRPWSNPPMPPALSAEQRDFFATQGYLVVPDALAPAELAAVRREADAAEARWRADPALPGVRRSDLEQVLGIMEHGPALFALLEQPRVF